MTESIFPGYRTSSLYPFLHISWYGEVLLTSGATYLLDNPRATLAEALALDAKHPLRVTFADATYLTPNRWANSTVPYPPQCATHELYESTSAKTDQLLIRKAHVAAWSDVLYDPNLQPLEPSVAGWSPLTLQRTDAEHNNLARAWSHPEPDAYFASTDDPITYASLAFRNVYHLALFHNLTHLDAFIERIASASNHELGAIVAVDTLPPMSINANNADTVSYAITTETITYSFILQVYRALTPPQCFTALPGEITLPPGEEDPSCAYITTASPLSHASVITQHTDEQTFARIARLHKAFLLRNAENFVVRSPVKRTQLHTKSMSTLSPVTGRHGHAVILDPLNLRFPSVQAAARFLNISGASFHAHIADPRPRLYVRCAAYADVPITPRYVYTL